MKQRVTIQMKAIEQSFHVVMFIMLYKVLRKVRGWNLETAKCDHSNESYWVMLSRGPSLSVVLQWTESCDFLISFRSKPLVELKGVFIQ